MAKGRKKIPAKLNQLHGNPGKRPLNGWELEVPNGVPPCPTELDAIAQSEWKRITPDLITLGILAAIDLAILTGYCHSFSQFVQTAAQLSKTGYLVKAPSGYPIVNPLISINNNAKANMLRFAQELGLSCIQRAKLKIDKKEAEEDDFESFMSAKKVKSGKKK